VFDLDGTITRRDTLLPYVLGAPVSPARKLIGLCAFIPALLAFIVGRRDHGALKSAFIRAVLHGVDRAHIDRWTAEFVPAVLERKVFADALSRLEQHRREGAHLVLMSASTDLYVPAIGRALSFDEVICTGVTWHADRLEGRLATPNRRGVEKARCFILLKHTHRGITAAYGNAGSDLDHLQLADQPLLVNASRRARQAAARLGVPCAHWV
jgi:phosphatidylglycerophosphatase C